MCIRDSYSAEVVEHTATTTVRPGGITVVGVLTLVLAGLGVAAGLIGIGGQAFSKGMAQKIIAESEANPENEALKFQADLQKETMAVADKYMIPNTVANIVSLLVCIGLFVGAIMLLSGSPKGRSLLLSLFIVVILVDIGKSALQFLSLIHI